MQRGEFVLEIALQRMLGFRGDIPLRKVKPEQGQRRDDEHHREEQFRAKTRQAGFLSRRPGSSRQIDFKRRAAFEEHRLFVCRLAAHPGAKRVAARPASPFSRKRPSASVTTKCGVASTSTSARMCS